MDNLRQGIRSDCSTPYNSSRVVTMNKETIYINDLIPWTSRRTRLAKECLFHPSILNLNLVRHICWNGHQTALLCARENHHGQCGWWQAFVMTPYPSVWTIIFEIFEFEFISKENHKSLVLLVVLGLAETRDLCAYCICLECWSCLWGKKQRKQNHHQMGSWSSLYSRS